MCSSDSQQKREGVKNALQLGFPYEKGGHPGSGLTQHPLQAWPALLDCTCIFLDTFLPTFQPIVHPFSAQKITKPGHRGRPDCKILIFYAFPIKTYPYNQSQGFHRE